MTMKSVVDDVEEQFRRAYADYLEASRQVRVAQRNVVLAQDAARKGFRVSRAGPSAFEREESINAAATAAGALQVVAVKYRALAVWIEKQAAALSRCAEIGRHLLPKE